MPLPEAANLRCTYRFGPFHLDPFERVLRRSGKKVVLPPKVFDTLVALVESEGHPVENQTLSSRIWGSVPMDESLLKFHVEQVRMALGEIEFVEALPPRGYRFIGDLERLELPPPQPAHGLTPGGVSRPPAFGKLVWGAAGLAAASLALVGFRTFQWPQAEPPSPSPRTLAVANFTASDSGDDALGLSISTGLIRRLQFIPGLTVRLGASGSGVDAVLSGNLNRAEGSIKATVHLNPVSGGSGIFSDVFDIPASQIFSLEPIVAKRVAVALRSRLTAEQEANLLRMPTQNGEAYRLYSGLISEPRPVNTAKIRQRITTLERIVTLDPEFALAHAALAEAHRMLALSGQPSKETLAGMKAAADKAIALDNRLPEAYVELGYASLFSDWDSDAAGKAARRALDLAPNSFAARNLNAVLLTAQSKFDLAIAERRRALEIDPRSKEARLGIAAANYHARRYDRAIEEYRAAIIRDAPSAAAVRMLARCLRLRGMNGDAFTEYSRADAIAGVSGRTALKAAFEEDGFEGYWRKRLAQRGRMNFYDTAVAYIEGGREWRAFKFLYKAFEAQLPELVFLHVDPVMDPIREDRRFRELVRRIGVAE